MDLKNILEENDNDLKKNPNVKVHKKPIQLKDIERRSRNSMLKNDSELSETDINKMVDDEKGKKYHQTWTRLDNGSKLNRLLLYSQKCKEDYELTDNEFKKLQKILINAINKNKFSKISEINYDKENGIISDIKVLEFNEDTRVFNLKFQETKSKPKSGSKSNIERLLKQ
mgnify:FL=1|tara:strand:+ start:252 stop:761 length:510 start_codon:yes stop_codon:yes gene_type:complete